MAFIYRYHIREKKIRDIVNLTDFKDEIINTIKEFHKNNLKDCRVEENFYEYRLHFSVDNKSLREFGKLLLKNCFELRKIREKLENKYTGFFVRKKHEYYAFLDIDENGGSLKLNLIDALDFNDLERFTTDARNKLNGYLESKNINIGGLDHELNMLSRSFYMDVFTLNEIEFDFENMYNSENSKHNSNVVLIKGYHRRDFTYGKINSELDVEELIKLRTSEDEHKNNHKDVVLEDGFRISEVETVNEDEIKKIMKSLDIYIKPVESIINFDDFDDLDYKNINFTVHNVGQALATSLSELTKPPFLYFDFGISEGKNLFNRPKNMTVDVSGKPSIIISHIHRDHWYGITVFTKAFTCDWYIPQQKKEILFQKRCAEIIVSGGSVSCIKANISSTLGTIFVGGQSRHDSTRQPEHKHDNGLGMNIKLFSKQRNVDVNILVPGDQRYDYIPQTYLTDIDILVASHHGGEYSWSERKTVNDDIQDNAKDGLIIYSYGYNNTHNHPSKENDYKAKRWTRSHKTAINSDFILK